MTEKFTINVICHCRTASSYLDLESVNIRMNHVTKIPSIGVWWDQDRVSIVALILRSTVHLTHVKDLLSSSRKCVLRFRKLIPLSGI